MQLRANDENDQVVFAHQADKGQDYFCMECKGALRLRGGIHRQKHFYHLQPPRECRQNGKSMEHLQVQCKVKELLGGDCALELPFPSIGRIADCVWMSKKVVFEVQCSPITQEEVSRRNADYASVGYRTVWLLHDIRFNQLRLSAAELWLRGHPHYFTNIDAAGDGGIYDQYDLAERGRRQRILEPSFINLKELYVDVGHDLPDPLRRRHENWLLGFGGDWVRRAADEETRCCLSEVFRVEALPMHGVLKSTLAWLWENLVVLPYRIVFAFLLERACR